MLKNTKQYNKNYLNEVSNQVERNKEILDMINGYITLADSKVSIFCGIFSAVFAVLVYFADNVYDEKISYINEHAILKKSIVVIGCLSAILFIVSLFFSIKAISPKFYKIESNRKGKFSIFYEEIATFKDSKEFSDCAKNSSIELYNDELLNEIYLNSKVCSKKMHQFKTSLWLSFFSIIFAISIIVVIFSF